MISTNNSAHCLAFSHKHTDSGAFIGPYRLEEFLGKGGSAEVFRATVRDGSTNSKRSLCLKCIKPEVAQNEELRELFIQEGRKIGPLLSHENIVPVIDCIEDGPSVALVMDLIQGINLKKLIVLSWRLGSGVPQEIVAHIAGKLLEALSYIHGKNIIHQDISPHNILISYDGKVMILDFGVAEVMQKNGAGQHGDRKIRGKLSYMSPEQIKRQGGKQADLYSAGLVLYELLTGKKFFSKKENHRDMAKIIAHATKPTLDHGSIDPQLAYVIENLLDPNLDTRFRTAEQALCQLPQCNDCGPLGKQKLRMFMQRFPVLLKAQQ